MRYGYLDVERHLALRREGLDLRVWFDGVDVTDGCAEADDSKRERSYVKLRVAYGQLALPRREPTRIAFDDPEPIYYSAASTGRVPAAPSPRPFALYVGPVDILPAGQRPASAPAPVLDGQRAITLTGDPV